MKFLKACESAMKYFKQQYGDIGLASVMDIGKNWLFSGKNENQNILYGKESVIVNKTTGELQPFFLSEYPNYKVLKNAVKIEVPEQYK